MYNELVDIGLNVDLSGLRAKLDEIDEKLHDGKDIDALVESAINDLDLESRIDSPVRDIVRDMMHSEGEEFVQGVITNMDFVTEDDISQYVRDNDLVDEGQLSQAIDDLRDDIPDTDDIVDRVISGLPDNEDVTKLETRLADLERRFEMYATRVDEQGQVQRAINERLDAMSSADLEDLNRIIDAHNSLEARVNIMAERLGDNHISDATTLLDLLRRAYHIIIGGRA